MKIVNDPFFSRGLREFTIAKAVETSMEVTHSDGELERLRERLGAQAKAIGLLVEQLASGMREADRKRFVGDFLGYRFKITD